MSPVCRRQKRTASHSVHAVEELKARGCLCRPVLCSLHPGQELRLFCPPCDLPVCLECAATLHRDHCCCPTHNVINQHRNCIQELVTLRLRPRMQQLEQALQKVLRNPAPIHATFISPLCLELLSLDVGTQRTPPV